MQNPDAQLQQLPWDHVRVFLAMARTRGLVGAARHLGVDKATVSRRLQALEQALKAQLFLRTREGLRLSMLGEQVLPFATAMEDAAASLASASAARAGALEGRVRVATTESFAGRLVQAGLLSVTAQHPRLEIELLGGNRPVDLLGGEAELALRLSAPQQRSLKVRIVARLGFALFASPQYLERRGTPLSPRQLEGHDVLLPSGELARLPETKWLLARRGVRVAFRSSSMGALLEAARSGYGLTVLTRAWGESEPGLRQVLPVPALAARPVWLVSTPKGLERPAVRVVANHLAAIVRSLARA